MIKALCIVIPRCLCSVAFGICIPLIITCESDELGEEELCSRWRGDSESTCSVLIFGILAASRAPNCILFGVPGAPPPHLRHAEFPLDSHG